MKRLPGFLKCRDIPKKRIDFIRVHDEDMVEFHIWRFFRCGQASYDRCIGRAGVAFY